MFLSVNARLVRSFAATAAAAGAAGGLLTVTGASVSAAPPVGSGSPAPIKATAPKTASTPAPKLPSNVFARVGNQDITGADLIAFLTTLGGYPLAQQRVQIAIADQQARKYGVTVTPAEVDKAVQEQKDTLVHNQMMQSTTPMTFEEIAAKQGINEGLLREQARFQLLLKKTYAKVAESSIQPIGNKIRISHLLISTQPTAQPDPTKPEPADAVAKRDADALAKIKQIQADVTAGKITWVDAIKQNSQDPSAKQNNGDLGWVDKDTQFVPEFLEAALKLQKVGEIAGPIKTQFGYHLIRLDARGADATAAQKAEFKKQQLDQALNNPQAIQGWFYGVTRSTNVTYNPNARFSAVVAPNPAPTKPTAAPHKAK